MAKINRSLAIVTGINQYEHIPKLKNAVADAEALADVLKTMYGYEVLLLTNQKATKANLDQLITHLEKQAIPFEQQILSVKSTDRVLFYFAGHGFPEETEDNKEGKPAGYFMPQDAEDGKPNTWLSMQKLYEALTNLNCHHLLMILDCCFAGRISWAGNGRNAGRPRKLYQQSYDHFIKHKTQQIITSAAHDEKAQDSFRFGQRGDQNGHSPFAHLLLKVLKGDSDSGKDKPIEGILEDKVITVQELFTYLQNKLGKVAEGQTPALSQPRKRDPKTDEYIFFKGEYLFPFRDFDPKALARFELNENTNPYKGLASFDSQDSQLFFGRKRLIEGSKEKAGLLTKVISQPLTVVLGLSGSGKSSLVKAGLIPALSSEERTSQGRWCTLNPLRPGESPLAALARAIFPITYVNLINQLINQLKEVDCFNKIFDPNGKQGRAAKLSEVEKAHFDGLMKAWEWAVPEAQLLLISDYHELLEKLCSDSDKQSLETIKKKILEILAQLVEELRSNPKSLIKIVRQWSQDNPNSKLLLTIDQCEEVVTLCRKDDEREIFLKLLAEALISPEILDQLRIVITLRTDYEPQIRDLNKSKHEEADWQAAWQRLWQAGRFIVTPMNREELQQVIEEPAAQRALFFESPKLVNDLIDEVIQMPGALPLLSFTLSELYLKYLKAEENKERDDRTITEEDYEKTGGVTRSLTQAADKACQHLLDKGIDESTIRDVMLRMISISGGELARRRVPVSELVYPEPKNEQVQKVLNCFIEARLLVKGKDTENQDAENQDYVEPAHDALVRGWSKLLAWKQKEQQNLLLIQRLTPAAEEWKSKKDSYQPKGALDKADPVLDWIDKRLSEIEGAVSKIPTRVMHQLRRAQNQPEQRREKPGQFLWDDNPYLDVLDKLKSKGNWFNQVELNFVQESVLQRRRNTSWWWRGAGAVTLFISGVLVFASIQWNNAQRQLVATISTLTNNSQELFESNKEFDALIASLNAGRNLKQLKFGANPDLERRIKDALLNAIIWVKEQNRLEGHLASVQSVSFSPNRLLLASASSDNTIRIWDATTGKTVHTLTGHTDAVNSVSFSPDGQQLASGSEDNTIRIWDVATGREIGTPLTGHTSVVRSVSFSPDGQLLASGSADGNIMLWDIARGAMTTTLTGHTGAINSISFSSDGQRLASGSEDATIGIWDVNTGTGKTYPFPVETSWGSIDSVSFSPDGKTLAFAGEDQTIKLWNIDQATWIKLPGHSGRIRSINFSHNGQILASASWDRTIKLWDAATGKEIVTLFGHREFVNSVSFSSDDQFLASASEDRSIKIWNIHNRPEANSIHTYSDEVWSLGFSPNGKFLAAGSRDTTINIWDVDTGEIKNSLKGDHFIRSVSFSPKDENRIAFATFTQITFWNVITNEKASIDRSNSLITSISFSPNGDLIAESNWDKSIHLWDVSTQRERISPLTGHTDKVNTVSFSPDGQRLASGSEDNTIRIWDVATGREIGTPLTGHTAGVRSVSFSPDGQLLVSGSADGNIMLWDITKGTVRVFKGHSGTVGTVSFSSDGRLLASGSEDHSIILWDVASGEMLTALEGRASGILSMSPGANGLLASGSVDKKVILWNYRKILSEFTLNALLVRGCDRVHSYLQNNPNVSESDRHLCDGTGN